MSKEIKNIPNISMPYDKVDTYGRVDGLSLQNLFYTNNGFFPSCYMFDYEARTNGDYIFDTKKMLNFLNESEYKDELELIPYFTKVLGKDEDKLEIGFCVILKKSNIYARFEKSVSESYVLFGNENIEDVEKFIEDMLQFYIMPESTKDIYWRVCSSQGGYYLDKGKVKCPQNFVLENLYNDDFKKEDEKICKFLEEDEKSGLVILHGEKGTGKSTYIKHLVSKYRDKKFVYIPAHLVPLFGDPSFGSFLTSLNNDIIVLEDCENIIKNRKLNEGASSVSLLLNMTDGILSDDLSMKFICTFNDDMKTIDPALLRKGRLVSKYEFRPLCIEKAEKILKERGVEAKLTKPLSLADIFHYGEDSYETKIKPII